MSTAIATSTVIDQAFRFMEMSQVSGFGATSDQMQSANQQYPVALDMVLELYDWSFARRIVELPPRTLALSDPDLPFAYEMPGDALVLRHVYGDCVNWRLDGDRIIHSDADANLTIRYTCRDVREKYLPGLFRTALSLQLAVLLSARWVTTRAKRNDLKANLADAIALAKRMDAHSASPARSDGRANQVDWASEAVR